jgi:transcriptional regulator with XRE-family HTH domain
MAVRQRQARDQIDPALWKRADMRAALAARDIAGVFKLLQRTGVSQRHIAALTGQSQSEISEILAGRQVVSYDLLIRIADGLGIPRGNLGLAYDDATAALLGLSRPGPVTDEGGEDATQLLARLAELTIDPLTWAQPFHPAWSPTPDRIDTDDVRRLATTTERLRALDREHGGGACRDAALAQLSWAQQLLRAQADEQTVRELHRAVADLHLVTGWTSFDLGTLGPARRHFGRALEHARFIEEPSLVAKALYCLGRLHLHHGWGMQALRLFQLGQVSAQESGHGRAVAMLHANLAWAYAAVGDSRQAVACIGRARDEFGRCEHEPAPAWLAFFDGAELQALRGTALAQLPDLTAQHRNEAIERFSYSTALRELPFARSRAFELTALAWLLIDNNELEHGLRVAHEAVDVASKIRSQRVIDRMGPLRASLARRRSHADVRDLVARIAALRR